MALDEIFEKAIDVEVRPMKFKDVAQLANWGQHEDIRYEGYNFPYKAQHEFYQWYRSKKQAFRRYLFGAFLEGELIGYITLKQIKWIKREAFMGLSLTLTE